MPDGQREHVVVRLRIRGRARDVGGFRVVLDAHLRRHRPSGLLVAVVASPVAVESSEGVVSGTRGAGLRSEQTVAASGYSRQVGLHGVGEIVFVLSGGELLVVCSRDPHQGLSLVGLAMRRDNGVAKMDLGVQRVFHVEDRHASSRAGHQECDRGLH